MVRTITWETKAKAKERPKDAQPTRTKKKGQEGTISPITPLMSLACKS